jgi:hypothetical protein
MVMYKDFSLLGILRHHSSNFQYLLTLIYRVAIVIFGLAILRESDTNSIKIYAFCINGAVFLAFFIGELWKFNTVMNSHLNLLNSCQYQDLHTLPQKYGTALHNA